eukprot:2262796-Prymnesium_polylepis.3
MDEPLSLGPCRKLNGTLSTHLLGRAAHVEKGDQNEDAAGKRDCKQYVGRDDGILAEHPLQRPLPVARCVVDDDRIFASAERVATSDTAPKLDGCPQEWNGAQDEHDRVLWRDATRLEGLCGNDGGLVREQRRRRQE